VCWWPASCATTRCCAASFVVLGLVLLAGAFAWQRIRPRPLPDLRTVPGALR
jgi:hypothetical protein